MNNLHVDVFCLYEKYTVEKWNRNLLISCITPHPHTQDVTLLLWGCLWWVFSKCPKSELCVKKTLLKLYTHIIASRPLFHKCDKKWKTTHKRNRKKNVQKWEPNHVLNITDSEECLFRQQRPPVCRETVVHLLRKHLIKKFPSSVPQTHLFPGHSLSTVLQPKSWIFLQKTLDHQILFLDSGNLERWTSLSSDYLSAAWSVCLWLAQVSKTRIPRTVRTMAAIPILMRFSMVWSCFPGAETVSSTGALALDNR